MQAPAMAQGESQSALLRCLSQLDVDAWAHALLPLLQEQHSAAAVALTCRTLRDRCHSNVQNLDLSSLQDSGDTDELQDALRSLPGQFSSCKNVQLVLEAETSYHNIPYLLPSIASLPSLHSLAIKVTGTLQALPMSTVLYSLRTQLSGLQSLALDLQQSWAGASAVWRELGRLTQLTALHIIFEHEISPAADLHKLSGLACLQSLSFTCGSPHAPTQPLPLAPMLNGLTALTEFELDACLVESISDFAQLPASRPGSFQGGPLPPSENQEAPALTHKDILQNRNHNKRQGKKPIRLQKARLSLIHRLRVHDYDAAKRTFFALIDSKCRHYCEQLRCTVSKQFMQLPEAKQWLCTLVTTDCARESKETDTWRGAPQWLDLFQYMSNWAESAAWDDADGGARAVMATYGRMA